MSAEQKHCAYCSRLFRRDVRYSRRYWERQKFCSQRCTGLANSERPRPSISQMLEKYTVKTDCCWIWTGTKDKDGYGLFGHGRRQLRAHVAALAVDGRPVPKGFYGCHTCDNPSCVNPAHLYVGTPTQNAQDAVRRGRLRPGRKAKLTPDKVRAIRAATGTHDTIAASFGISRTNVSLIRQGKTWRAVL